jgi:hypothetical protein
MVSSQFNIRGLEEAAKAAIREAAPEPSVVPILPQGDRSRGDGVGDRISGQSRYDFNYRAFPNDLGTEYARDYIIININVPTNAVGPKIFQERTSLNQQNILPGEISTVERARSGELSSGPELGITSGNPLSIIAGAAAGFNVNRNTRRIAESIAIFMPAGGLVYNYQNKYEEISMTALTGKVASGIADTVLGVAGAVVKGAYERTQQIARATGGIVDAGGRLISQAALLTGFPINPRVEVLFSHNNLRQFRFDFLMAPRNVQESETIKEIIRILRYNSAPELGGSFFGTGSAGFTYIPPAEFDISIYHNNIPNPHIPRINTCVLTVIEVQYDPTDGIFSTFSNGHPVAVRMTLGFQEIEPLHKKRINEGF